MGWSRCARGHCGRWCVWRIGRRNARGRRALDRATLKPATGMSRCQHQMARPETLSLKGYDYWALGHVHNRELLRRDPWVHSAAASRAVTRFSCDALPVGLASRSL